MAYTEIKKRKNNRYYYRVRSIRMGQKFKKERIYLGANLLKKELEEEQEKADKKLMKDKIENSLINIKSKIVQVLSKNNVKKAGVFGSYAKGEQNKKGDIDILIKPPKGIGFGFVRIAMELEKKLGKKVDLVSYNGISPYLKNKILSQEIRLI